MRKIIIIIFLAIGIQLMNYIGYSSYNRLEVHYLNIGQGDSTLIITPDRKTILIDGGESGSVIFELSEVLPAWVKKIDIMMITHTDLDHLGGMLEVINRYEVGVVYFNAPEEKGFTVAYFIDQLSELEIPLVEIFADDDQIIGCCVEIDFLWPVRPEELNLDPNDTSLSFMLKYKGFTTYMAGDLSYKYEEKILAGKKYDVDVMKASHHGSKTSSSQSMLKRLNPETAIISCGVDNKFGHPHQEVLDALDEEGVSIIRTDLAGRITLETDGIDYYITTEN